MNIHTIKIKRILEHLSYDVLSLYPRLLCHRLYLLYGVESVLQQMDLPEWKQHADILKRGTDIDKILDHELKNKNIHFRNGVAGITFISNQYYQITEDTSFLPGKEKLIHKIMSSEYWEWIESKQPKEKNDTGFLNGLTGVAMQLLDLLKEKSEKVKNLQIHVES